MISGTLARDILNSIFLIFEENRRDSEVMRGKVINQAKDEFPTLQLMPDTGQDDDGVRQDYLRRQGEEENLIEEKTGAPLDLKYGSMLPPSPASPT